MRINKMLEEIKAQLQTLEAKLDVLLGEAAKRRKRAEDRRRQLHDVKRQAEDGKVPLPPFHIMQKRDPRMKEHLETLVHGAMQFAANDDPEGFVAWLVYYWNSCVYLKKPITFSGGYYRVYVGSMRMGYGAFDLLGFHKKQRQKLRNEAERDDFSKRPWWDWGYLVLLPVWLEMRNHKLPKRFSRCVQILLGDFGGYEVFEDVQWGPSEDLHLVNRMLARVGTDLWRMWRACIRGLRTREPVPLPQRSEAAGTST